MAIRDPHDWSDLSDPSLVWGRGCGRGGDHWLHLIKRRESVLKKERNLLVAYTKGGPH